MLPEQQQRILGYFIEEAKDHLNTIEQGLLNLQTTLEDPEMVNEIFRAAHSIKGGAAMLGLNSIQRTAHRLEDFFKILKECLTIQIDQKLESLFLQVFDVLKALLEQLEGSGLIDDVANQIMSEVEPVFAELNQHLELLVNQAGGTMQPEEISSERLALLTAVAPNKTVPVAIASFFPVFQSTLLQQLRHILQLFKQPETPQTRQELEACCNQLVQLGEQFNLPSWCTLCKTALSAIANEDNTYRTLAPIIIKELKQAQELVLAGREAEIATCEQLQTLAIATCLFNWEDTSASFECDQPLTELMAEDDLSSLFAKLDENDSLLPAASELSAFLALETDVETSPVQDSGENLPPISFDETLALDNLFGEAQETLLDSTVGAELSDLFDAPEAAESLLDESDPASGSENSENSDLLSNLWNDLWGVEPELNFTQLEENTLSNNWSELVAMGIEEMPLETETSNEDSAAVGSEIPVAQEAADLASATDLSAAASSNSVSDEFEDLEKLLQEASTPVESADLKPQPRQAAATNTRRPAFEQMMRVPVKHLDNINNLVGELVVYRNSLEQDQERLRQFLGNLLHQVQQISDVGARMQELYERSLLESSLLNSCQGSRSISLESSATSKRHVTGVKFDALEMDRFTGFHTLSQEIIELIVRVREATSDIEFVTDETEQVARQFRQVTTQLQEGLTRSRMVPFGQIADRLPRAVRDISIKYGKQAELHIEGKETLIDKVILEQLYDPMTHLVNNAITHGIEFPEQRVAKGKSPVGQITIRAFYQGNQTTIAVSDDGAGIDAEQVKAKAIQKGLITSASANDLSRLDVYNLLFNPGFTTKEQVDEFAGRGIGMDVVLTSLSQIRGSINTDSTLGKGTTFTIRLPLTLSICKALCCLSDKARIAFPMDSVEQMLDIPAESIVANAEGQTCIPWRDSLLPFRPLKELLNYNRPLSRGNVYGGNRGDDMISVVVLRSADMFLALQVDQVLGEQEIVIKQFEGPAPKPIGIAGATVLGDGRIMPIADVLELIDLATGQMRQSSREMLGDSGSVLPKMPAVKTEPMVLIVDDSITVRELLSMTFSNAGYRVEQARDGYEAWDKLRDGLPCDLVFCDIEMPRMDGLELLSRMQKDPGLCELPIAMLTSRGSARHRQMAIQLGASGYFTKPYLEEALLDGAQRMLKGEVLVTGSSNI